LTKDATVRKFPALTNVVSEISQVKTQIPDSKQLLDENFTRERLRQELGKTIYPIIHIATHAQFGTDPEDTFLVTGNNDKLTTELDAAIRIGRESDLVELLALTACQTAVEMTVLRLVWLASPCRLVSEAPWLPFGLSRCTHCNVSNSVYS